jgi:hypothetical protein
MRTPFLFCCILMVFSAQSVAQTDSLHITTQFLGRLAEVRSALLVGNPQGAKDLGKVMQELKSEIKYEDEFLSMRTVNQPIVIGNTNSGNRLNKRAGHQAGTVTIDGFQYRQDQLSQFYNPLSNTPVEHQIILDENRILRNLGRIGLIKDTYPFTIPNEINLLDEILFYQVAEKERIFNVCVYNQNLVLGLAMTFDSLTVYSITPVRPGIHVPVPVADTVILKQLPYGITQFSDNFQNLVFSKNPFEQGKKFPFEAHTLDKVILRNSLSEQTNKAKYLGAINELVKPGGMVFIYQTDYSKMQGGHSITKPTQKRKLVKYAKKHGMTLERTYKKGFVEIYAFRTSAAVTK